MASYVVYGFLLAIAVMAVGCAAQSTPTSCTPFQLDDKPMYENCTTLGNSTLQWTYVVATGEFDTGFSIQSQVTDGWVAWGINSSPDGGMVGTQAIITVVVNGTRIATPYNITGAPVSTFIEGDLDYPVSNISTSNDGNMVMIFAKWMLAPNTTMFNPTWQVGPAVELVSHEFLPENLNAYAVNTMLVTDGSGDSPPMTPPMTPPTTEPSSATTFGSSMFCAVLLSTFVFL